MNTPAWLQAAGLAFWGFAAQQPALGLMLAASRLLAGGLDRKLALADKTLERAVDLTALAAAALFAVYLGIAGLPRGLLAATGWLPVALYPLLLIDALNKEPLRWRHLAFALRRSAHADAQRPARPAAAWLAATVLAASVLAQPSLWFFVALATLLVAWLAAARPPRRRRQAGLAFGLAALVAVALGFAASRGLREAQQQLQQWVVDQLSDDAADPYQRRTGIGELGRLKLSDRIAWRVEVANRSAPPRHLRSGVFTHYRDGQWFARRDDFVAQAPAPAAAPLGLRLEGESRRGRALPPLPQRAGALTDTQGSPGNSASFRRNAYGVARIDDAPPRLALGVTASAYGREAPPDAGDRVLPPAFPALFAQLPELSQLAGFDEERRLAGVMAWFGAGFRYTLFLGTRQDGQDGKDVRRDLERFLLVDRAGHCEYFATATVLILRALDIPARYVTGYSMQEYSRLEKAWLLRDRHAHAWVEAFVGGRWIEVDTTPASWLEEEADRAPVWQPAIDFASFVWHRLLRWRETLANADPANDTRTTATQGALGALLIGALLWVLWRRRRAAARAAAKASDPHGLPGHADAIAQHPDAIEFRRLEARFASLGLPRRQTETPAHWIARVLKEGGSVVAPADRNAAPALVAAYYRLRYGPAGTPRKPGA